MCLGSPLLSLAEDERASSGESAESGLTHRPISESTDFEEIIVTGAPHSRTRFDVIQGTSVLSREELEGALMSTLGETLAELPGISSSYFGPGASRPVIRGLDGPRVRVLQNGLGALDASVTSPDHAVATEGLLVERVEIIRGAGTLLFGGSAIGGVINVDDGRIPLEQPAGFVQADVRGLYGSAADERGGSLAVATGLGAFALRAAGALAQSNDLQIPGYAVSSRLAEQEPDLPRGPDGLALSTQTDRRTGTAGVSWIGEDSMVGASYGVTKNDYGVPAEPGELVSIDLEQERFDSRGVWGEPFWIFSEASYRYGYADYQHKEIEGAGELASLFKNEAHEARIDLIQKEYGGLHGTLGLQILHRDMEVSGEEAHVPPNVTTNWGVFAVEEYHFENLRLEGGLRYEWQQVKADRLAFERTFSTVSFSLGAGYTFFGDSLVGFNISRTERAPSAEELLANGAHLATGGFDLGDSTLSIESGLTVEVTGRRRGGRWSGGVNLYWTRFDNFIYQENGEYCDPAEDLSGSPICVPDPLDGQLQLREFTQSEVVFWGGEITGAFDFYQSDSYTGLVDVAFDWVNATVTDGPSDSLPRIPPYRIKAGVEGRSDYGDLRFEVWWVRAQDKVANNELPTDAYVMLNLIGTVHPFPDQRNVTLIVQGRNLLDAEARVHSSFLKDKLPLPGREVRLSVSVAY